MDDIWERHEARLALFESLDRYVELAKEYREWKHERDTEITEGTAEDLEYRYQDYIKTSEGNKLHRLMVLVRYYRNNEPLMLYTVADTSLYVYIPMSRYTSTSDCRKP